MRLPMAKKIIQELQINSASDLVTPREETRAGFVAMALEKNYMAGPYIQEGVGRLVQSLLFETSGGDPMTILAATLLLTLVVLAAGFAPAYRASKVHPMEALRYE
jgi:hypothetical protein